MPSPVQVTNQWSLARVARIPDLRALAWSDDYLYASRGYHLLRTKVPLRVSPSPDLSWQSIASHSPELWRSITAKVRLTSRLLRDGFHALAVLPSNALVAAIPGAILTMRPGDDKFQITHRIIRGTRPLHITVTPGGKVYWGEYFDNPARDEVYIYGSNDQGATWNVAYTFPKRAIRHVHNIVYDPWGDCLWVLTGDYGDECRVLRASCDFSKVETVLQGNQQARAVALIPTADGLYFSSDTPLESNFIYRLDRQGTLSQLTSISASSIYGCRVKNSVFFSTMVEPSAVNRDRNVRIYGICEGKEWQPLLAWKKDFWPMKFFQYGNAFLPDGNNTTPYLAVSTLGVTTDDMSTSLYSITPREAEF
jgi:hypothetical protein